MPHKRRLAIFFTCVILCVGFAGVVYFGVTIGSSIISANQNQAFNDALLDGIDVRPATSVAVHATTPSVTSLPVDESEPNDAQNNEVVEEPYDMDLQGEHAQEWIPFVDFGALAERLPGVMGWIQMGDTTLNYPIMQWTDNDFFLYRLPDGTRNRNGSIFLDYRNSPDFTDRNTLIYGHMMRTDDMFGILKHFREQSFFEANPSMYIYTPYRDYRLYLFSAYLVDSVVEQPTKHFGTEDEFLLYIEDIKQRSFFVSDVEIGEGDRIVSLCTCAYDFPNARLIVVGKLVEL